ncbi:MAG: aldo/keto reductase [Erysipelotrichaceae bacterium]|jgi:predicted aldo/keto reductase-like oxidoreductase|nr:aldo/keto reductase [Erysipelotrichaceae bacterium]
MEYRKFKKLNVRPSLLAFGCMRLPLNPNGKIDEAQVAEMFDHAIQGGVTYFDTAYPYHQGESEVVVGKLLKKYPRDSFTITTKLPLWEMKGQDDILRIFEEQLTKLQVDYVDFYLLHAIDKARYLKFKEYDIFTVIDSLKRQGKIRHFGFSFHGSYEDFEEIVLDGLDHWDVVQIQLNYMDINLQAGLKGYDLLVKHEIPVLIMEPIKGGALAKLPDVFEQKLKEIHPDWNTPSWALRFLMAKPGIVSILSGMSNLKQMDDNINTFNLKNSFDSHDEKTLLWLKQALEARIGVGCTNCQYCVPCPFGVRINEIFAVYNEMYMYDKTQDWDLIRIFDHYKIKNCVKCGVCMKKCPQSIKIPAVLEKVVSFCEAHKATT